MAKQPSGFRVGNVQYGRFSGVNPSRAANKNLTVKDQIKEIKGLRAESDKMLKEASRDWKINSGKYAYEPKPPSTALKINKAVKSVAKGIASGAGGIARGAMRAAGPAGALVSMTTPAGTGSDKPKGPLMTGNSKGKGPGGGSLSAPNRTAPSSSKMSVTGGRGVTAFGGSSGQAPKVAGGKGDLNSPYRTASGVPARTTPTGSGGARGPTGPQGQSRTSPAGSGKASTSRGPSSGPTSAPSRTAPSKANLGTSRF